MGCFGLRMLVLDTQWHVAHLQDCRIAPHGRYWKSMSSVAGVPAHAAPVGLESTIKWLTKDVLKRLDNLTGCQGSTPGRSALVQDACQFRPVKTCLLCLASVPCTSMPFKICHSMQHSMGSLRCMQSTADADQKPAGQQQSWVFKATCKLTQQRTAITTDELQQWDVLFGDLFAVLEREGLLGDQQQAVTDAQSHALPRDIASLTQVGVIHYVIEITYKKIIV